MTLKKFVLALAFLAALLVLGVYGLIWYFFPDDFRGHTSDEGLIKTFEAHAEEFQTLITMFREDSPVSIVHPTFTQPMGAITDERWNEYKRLFKLLGLHGGIRSNWRGEDCIEFAATVEGFVFHGSSKGYLYKPDRHAPLYPTLNPMSDDLEGNGDTAYRKINEDWYLYFQCCH